jgi:sulfhydrogenase subunit beta (sulfur reductase)
MKYLKLPKEKMDFFTFVLHKFGEIHAPLKKGDKQFAFGKVPNWSEVALDYNRTILPTKKYFLKPVDTLFRFSMDKGYEATVEDADQKLILFGVHSCDIYSLKILDLVFAGKYVDNYYFTRRSQIGIIGIDCVPDEHCFCHSMRADTVHDGFDLFLSDIGDAYLTLVGTSLGDDIVLASGGLFQEVTRGDIEEYKRRSNERDKAFKLDVELRDFAGIMEMEYGSSTWKDLGDKCLSCGSCSMVCPTCYCYDVYDELNLDQVSGQRKKMWDSCLRKEHALVAGGENFRKHRSDRVKFRYYHKQRGFVAEYGRPSCVGCGRCIVACPAKIDIVEVIKKIRGEESGHYPVEHGALR